MQCVNADEMPYLAIAKFFVLRYNYYKYYNYYYCISQCDVSMQMLDKHI